MPNAVSDPPAAHATEAEAYFADSSRFETDFWDVHAAKAAMSPTIR